MAHIYHIHSFYFEVHNFILCFSLSNCFIPMQEGRTVNKNVCVFALRHEILHFYGPNLFNYTLFNARIQNQTFWLIEISCTVRKLYSAWVRSSRHWKVQPLLFAVRVKQSEERSWPSPLGAFLALKHLSKNSYKNKLSYLTWLRVDDFYDYYFWAHLQLAQIH